MDMKPSKPFFRGIFPVLSARLSALILAAALVTLLLACNGTSAVFGGLGKPSDPIPFMEDIRTGTLQSGLRYFILENSMPENRASMRLVIKAGSLHEEDHEQGLAHFVEHMAFRGTERFPESDLINYLRSLGMSFGSDLNAFVSFDRTVYMIDVPIEVRDGTPVIPDTALAIIDDWSRAITFDPEIMDTERLVIVEEYRTRLGAMERIRREWLPVLFRGSRFADRMPIGQLDIIKNAPVEDLKGFYNKWYQADNMAIVFVGDFDGAALESSLEDHFHIEAPQSPTPSPVFDLPPAKKGNLETLVLTDQELGETSVILYFKRGQQPVRADLASFREDLIDFLIQNMLQFRFDDEIVNPETPFIAAGGGTERWGASSRFYTLSAEAKSGLSERTLEELLRAKESVSRYGFTDSEIALAGNALVSQYQRLVQERDRRQSGTFMNFITTHYVEGEGLSDVEWELDAIQRLLPGIKARDINAAVKDYFAANDIQVFIFAPEAEKENLPGEDRIKQLVRESAKMEVQRPVSRAAEGSLLEQTPQPGSIVSQSVDTETGATLWNLSNGAKVILQPTANRNDEIVLNAMARGGTTSASDRDSVSATLAVEMMLVSGLGPWSLPDLTRQIAAKQASLSFSTSGYTRSFQGTSTTGDLETMFEMLHLYFTDQRIDPLAVEAMLARYRTSIAQRGENPQVVFRDEINKTMTGDHPRFRPLSLDDLQKVDIDAALAFLQKSLNPADFTFVFAGNLTPELLAPYVETYLASIVPVPESENFNTWADLGIVRPGIVENRIYRGIEEQSIVNMTWFAPAAFSEQLSITSQVLNEYLSIVLNDEIREKMGGVYGIGAGVAVSPTPKGELSLRIQFTCDPRRVQELSDAVIRLLQNVSGSTTAEVFDNAVKALHQNWAVQMQSNSFIAQSYANSTVLLNQPLSRLQRRPGYFDAVTHADIQRLTTQLTGNGPAKVILFPAAYGAGN
jgi:zinc protease